MGGVFVISCRLETPGHLGHLLVEYLIHSLVGWLVEFGKACAWRDPNMAILRFEASDVGAQAMTQFHCARFLTVAGG